MHIVLLVDRSASMKTTDPNEDRLQAMSLFVSLLERDRVAIVSFGNDPKEETKGLISVADQTQRDELLNLINKQLANSTIPQQQATNMLAGLEKTYEVLEREKGGSSRDVIILLTDGAPCQPGGFRSSQEEQEYRNKMMQTVIKGKNEGVYLFAFGFLSPSFVADPDDPCMNPDPELLKSLNEEGLRGLDPQVIAPFLNAQELYVPGADQIVSQYLRVWQALYGTQRADRTLQDGSRIQVYPGTRSLFALVPFAPPARPVFSLRSGQGPGIVTEELLRHEIGRYLVARKDNPIAGERDVELRPPPGDAVLLYQLDFVVRVLDEIDGGQIPDVLEVGDEARRATFALVVEPKNEYPDADAVARSGELEDRGLLRLDVRPVDEDNPQKCDIEKKELQRDEANPTRFEGDRDIYLPPGKTEAQFEVVAGLVGLDTCSRHPFTVRRIATPTPTPAPPAVEEGGGGGGTPWWVYLLVVLGVIAVALLSWLLYRQTFGQRPHSLEGTLSGSGLASGPVYLNMLGKRRATLGGPGNDIEVAGISGSAAVLFTERRETEDATLIEPIGRYSVYVVPWDYLGKFKLVGLAGLPAVGAVTELPREALIVLAADDQELARLEWRAAMF